jgi:hypothetical protein
MCRAELARSHACFALEQLGATPKDKLEGGDMTTKKLIGRLAAGFATVLVWVGSAAAQTVVVGTGNPNMDVPAVQAAVDQGGDVVLKGHFSFDRPPTITVGLPGYPPAMVLVSKAVVISGARDASEEMAIIEGGTQPFDVEAPGARVEIRRLRFIRPKAGAINVIAVGGLVVASCKIEGVDPLPGFGSQGVEVGTTFFPPTPANMGKPEQISGTIVFVDNDIDVSGATPADNAVGLLFFSLGQSPDNEVDVYVSGNTIRNIGEPAIDVRLVGGRAYVERNVIVTGSVSGINPRPQAIRLVNTGSYLVAHNSIDCGWASPDAEGIGVFSQVRPEFGQQWPIKRAIIVDNDVTMSPPEGTAFGTFSAGIGVYGSAQGNVVLNNRIRGRARAGVYVDVFVHAKFGGGTPDDNALVLNGFDDFEASVADIFVGNLVTNTRVVGQGTIEDHGVGTVVERVPF